MRNTQAGPASATTTPPRAGPTARPRLNVRAPSAMAWGNSALGTSSGWMACHAGSVSAVPTPRKNVSVSSESGVITSARDRKASSAAVTSIHAWLTMSRRRRSTMSAERAGRESDEEHRQERRGLHQRATRVGDAERSPISHAAPTFCIIEPMFEAIYAMNRARKTGWRSGAHGDIRGREPDEAASSLVTVTNRNGSRRLGPVARARRPYGSPRAGCRPVRPSPRCTRWRNSAGGCPTTEVGSTARAVAARRSPYSGASSPKYWPGP